MESLRQQALKRMQQWEPQIQKASDEAENHTESKASVPEQQMTSCPSNPLAFLQQLGIDKDRLILLLTLFFLYRDQAKPKLLLAILYILL
jgi:hypothetical protein